MTAVADAAGRRARAVGRGLVAASGVGLAVVPWLADMNRNHTLGPGWDAHAKLHGIATVLASTGEGALTTALALGRRDDTTAERFAVGVAAALPMIHWLPFNVSALLPPTSVDESHRKVPRLAGVLPVNLLAQNVLGGLAGAGLALHRWGTRRG